MEVLENTGSVVDVIYSHVKAGIDKRNPPLPPLYERGAWVVDQLKWIPAASIPRGNNNFPFVKRKSILPLFLSKEKTVFGQECAHP